jgi:hypothetical protein
MAEKLSCPVCSTFSIEPVMRDVEFAARLDNTTRSLSDFVAFSCFQGHVFLVMSRRATPMLSRIASLLRKQQRFPSIPASEVKRSLQECSRCGVHCGYDLVAFNA